MYTQKLKLLFLCSHNRCRSILAEAICRHLADDVIEARSAGSDPAREVHPLTLRYLEAAGIATAQLRSKGWDELPGFSPDAVITVCDRAADEMCPLWLGRARKVHWNLSDPTVDASDPERTTENFRRAIATLELRIGAFADCLRRGALYCDSLLLLDHLGDIYPEGGQPLITLTPPRVMHEPPRRALR
jgi:arsenate reductase